MEGDDFLIPRGATRLRMEAKCFDRSRFPSTHARARVLTGGSPAAQLAGWPEREKAANEMCAALSRVPSSHQRAGFLSTPRVARLSASRFLNANVQSGRV